MRNVLSKLATAGALAGTLAVVAATEASATPANGLAITAAAPTLPTEVRYRASSDATYPAYWGRPAYTYWGYPAYSYWGYPGYPTYWRSYPTYNGYVSWW